MSNGLVPDHDSGVMISADQVSIEGPTFAVGPDLGTNCSQWLSADDKLPSKERN